MKAQALAPRSRSKRSVSISALPTARLRSSAVTGAPRLPRFPAAEDGSQTETFRSILFFEAQEEAGGTDSTLAVGNDAIRRYLAAAGNGRLVQSLKSFLADKTFESTDIMGETYTLGDLIAPIISALRDAAIAQFGELPTRIVVGRPVHFAAAGNPDEALARSRLDIAIRRAGWNDVVFEYEPVAAAYDYALRITRDETVLIADFGGGTSDFSVLQLKPRTAAKHGAARYEILGNDGVGIAGDAFDGRVMRHLVAPALGRGTVGTARPTGWCCRRRPGHTPSSSDGITCRS